MYVIDSNNLIKIRVSHSGLDYLVTDFVTSLLIGIYSFYHVLHVAARFLFKIVKMWVSPLVLDPNIVVVVVNHCFMSLFCTNGLLSDIVIL